MSLPASDQSGDKALALLTRMVKRHADQIHDNFRGDEWTVKQPANECFQLREAINQSDDPRLTAQPGFRRISIMLNMHKEVLDDRMRRNGAEISFLLGQWRFAHELLEKVASNAPQGVLNGPRLASTNADPQPRVPNVPEGARKRPALQLVHS